MWRLFLILRLICWTTVAVRTARFCSIDMLSYRCSLVVFFTDYRTGGIVVGRAVKINISIDWLIVCIVALSTHLLCSNLTGDDETLVTVISFKVLLCSSRKYFLWKCWCVGVTVVAVLVDVITVDEFDDCCNAVFILPCKLDVIYSMTVPAGPNCITCVVDVGIWLRFLFIELLLLTNW